MSVAPDRPAALFVVGGLHIDEVARLKNDFVERASNPVSWSRYAGGVASNAARAAHAQFCAVNCGSVTLHAALGHDESGQTLVAAMQAEGVNVVPHWSDEQQTDRYSAIITRSGELLTGFADIQLAEKLPANDIVSAMHTHYISSLLLDANLSAHCIGDILQAAGEAAITCAALAVSPVKAIRLLPFARQIKLLFCNRREALALAVASGSLPENTSANQPTLLELADSLSNAGFVEFILTDGAAQLLLGRSGEFTIHAIPKVAITHTVNGAGDALAGATLAALTLGAKLDDAVMGYGVPMATQIVTGRRLPISL